MLPHRDSPPAAHIIEIDADHAGQRVDNFLMAYLKGVPKSRIYRLLRKGEVRLNKGRIKADQRLAAGDRLRIPPVRVAERSLPVPGPRLLGLLESAVLFEDEYLIAINKPQGLAVHGGSGVDLGLIESLRHQRGRKSLELIHRIDRETSGVVLIAKRRSALRTLQQQFRDSFVEKAYSTLVMGDWPAHLQRVDAPLLKNQLQGGERIVQVHSGGKPSVTEFSVFARFGACTLMEARPLTGRTHQIRVHAQFAGHAIAGDEKYGAASDLKQARQWGVQRLFLHAARIRFSHPARDEMIEVTAPLSDDLSQALKNLEANLG